LQNRFIQYRNSVVAYGMAGIGSELLVCFHGFGESYESFAVLEEVLGSSYILIGINFPFHEGTEWSEGLIMQPQELFEIIRLIQYQEDCKQQSFSLLGYSLGGRIAMHLLQMIPEKINRMVLLAPDGLVVNPWYWVATQTWLGNKLFYATMQNPSWILWMVKAAYKLGFFNKSIIKFIHSYLDDKAVRMMLYKRWTTMRKFKPNLHLVNNNIKTHSIPTRFVFGSYDRIILRKRSALFEKDNVHVKIIELNSGHQLLKEKHVKDIAALFSL